MSFHRVCLNGAVAVRRGIVAVEVTMQWWDALDDLWYAARLRLSALHYIVAPLNRALLAVAGLLLIL